MRLRKVKKLLVFIARKWAVGKYYTKQLLPLKYHTTYISEGKQYSHTWRMWFGRVFQQRKETYNVDGGE